MQDDGAIAAQIFRLEIEHLDQKLGQLINAGGKLLGRLLACRIGGEQRRVMVLHHAGAGTGRYDHRPVVREQGQLERRHLPRLVGKPAGIGRLTAAGLRFREVHADALALEQSDGIHAGTGEELVYYASCEEIDISREYRSVWHFVSVEIIDRSNGKTNNRCERNFA